MPAASASGPPTCRSRPRVATCPAPMCWRPAGARRTGWIIVRDVLLMGPWHDEEERPAPSAARPTDYDAEHILLRTVRCVNGEVQLIMDCEPVFDYGRTFGSWAYTERGLPPGRLLVREHGAAAHADQRHNIGFEGPRAIARTMLKEGESRFVALSWGSAAPPRTFDDAYGRLVWTAHHWQHWLARGRFPDHPWRTYLERSALTLKGLTYAPTGAMVAAATTSLPETPGGERNWDYRYTWIRDSTFALWGLYTPRLRLGGERLPLLHRRRGRAARTCRSCTGWAASATWRSGILDAPAWLRGRQAGPHRQRRLQAAPARRVGRDARLGLPAHAARAIGWTRRSGRSWSAGRAAPRRTGASPIAGIWEVRGEPKHFTSSKVMCWVAADRGARLARLRDDDELAGRWQAAADEIKADILRERRRRARRLHPALRHRCARRLAAAAAAGALPAAGRRADRGDGPRHRRRADGRRPGPALPDGRDRRRPVRARRAPSRSARSGWCRRWSRSASCERARRAVREAALLRQPARPVRRGDRSAQTGRHLGNFPQAFTHLALINAVMHVIHAEQSDATPAPLAPQTADDDGPRSEPVAVDEMEVEPAAGRAARLDGRQREWQRQRRRLRVP